MSGASDTRDRIVQTHTPAVMVPRYTALEPLEKIGHRYLIAEDGLWLEVRRPWFHMRALIGPIVAEGIKLPYGRVSVELGWGGKEFDTTYAFKPAALDSLQALFVHDARRAMPNEFAAWATWNERTGQLDYRPLIATEASPGSITFARPHLEEHEHLAIDLHSHGSMDAFFSSTDDDDDAGEVKLSVVIGRLDKEDGPMFATRLCALGLFVDAASDKVTAYAGEASI